MPLQPLQFVETACVQTSGDVTIHPGVAIAPGTILRAAPDSRIVIASGVCLGMGVVLNASGGAIEIEAGASLGAGVLMVGAGKIGANACIGGVTTIFNSSVAAMQIVPAGSILGDGSRRIDLEAERMEPGIQPQPSSVPSALEAEEADKTAPQAEETPEIPAPDDSNSSKTPGTPVYGQIRVNQLLYTLFPKGNAAQRPPSEPRE